MIDGVRRLLGDDHFFEAMREYVDADRFRVASADSLIGAWSRHSPSSTALMDHLARFLGPRIRE
jgi:aminopeptidase N